MDNKLSPADIAERAKQNYQAGDYVSAAQVFDEASKSFKDQGDALMSAEMKNNQSVALLRAKQAQAALDAAQGTDKVFAGAGDARREGMALANQASAHEALKHFKEAIDLYVKAGEALKIADEDELRVEVMQLLSTLYLRRFKFYDAILALQSGLAAVKNPTPETTLHEEAPFLPVMIPDADLKVRPAVLPDQRLIANLIHFSPHVHRHLDWRNPLDWIGSSPYFVIEYQGQVIAAMGCPPDPPAVAWVRLFANSGKIPVQESWKVLWEKTRTDLAGKGSLVAAAIILQDWLEDIVISSNFSSRQSIVMLEREGSAVGLNLPAEISIRAMMPYDLPAVADVDAAAFELLWQNSLPALERAYPQAVLATVAEMDGKVIGYQISTRNPYGVHLARLAVLPARQGHGVGYALVADLIQQSERRGLSRLTVNTQSDNMTSLALYQRMGFHETGERYPVYQLQVN